LSFWFGCVMFGQFWGKWGQKFTQRSRSSSDQTLSKGWDFPSLLRL